LEDKLGAEVALIHMYEQLSDVIYANMKQLTGYATLLQVIVYDSLIV